MFNYLKKKSKKQYPVPEAKWQVVIENGSIKSTDYDENEVTIPVTSVEQIIIETNDTGPWGTDWWWKIHHNKGILSIPGGATRENLLVDFFQKLPQFDNEQFIQAMRCGENKAFIVWQR